MKSDITREEALSLLQSAMLEPLGLLVYASDPQVLIQALYRAKKTDSSLIPLQIRQTAEGIAICHEPHDGLPENFTEGVEKEESDDQTFC
jgi:hypothetical protein